MKFKGWLVASLAVAMCLANSAQAQQISVPAGGTAPIAFGALPTLADGWSTLSIAGGSGDIATDGAMDTAVNLLTAAGVNTALGESATVTPAPSQNAIARWNSVNLNVQSRPTGNSYLALMATLRNDTGADATSLTISYDLGALVASGSTILEQLFGHRVYVSTTGAAGSWGIAIPAFSTGTAGPLTATIPLDATPWGAGTLLYVIWADDNGSDDNAGPTEEGVYTIDNVVFNATGGPVTPRLGISAPANGSSFNQSVNINVTVTAAGMSSVEFLVDGSSVSTDTTAPFTATLSGLSVGAHTLRAIGTRTDNGTAFPATNNPINFTILANTAPFIQITNPASGFSVLVGTAITNTPMATDDVAVVYVDWFLDGNLVYTRSNSTWQYVYNDATFGTHTIMARAHDAAGLATDSAAITVNVTNPLAAAFTVALPNGSTWDYYTGGEPPLNGEVNWKNPLYDEGGLPGGWASGVAEFGGGDGATSPAGATDSYPEKTAIPLGPAATRFTGSFYRKTIILPENISAWNGGLLVRLLRDDGAVVYINDKAVWTNNIAPTGDPAPYADLATAAAGDDGTVYQEFLIPRADIPSGPNLAGQPMYVAVQVHQNSITSSDLSFDLMLWGVKIVAPSVSVTSPTSGQNVVGRCAAATVPVTADASTFVTNVQFFLDGSLTPAGSDATRPFSFSIPGVSAGAHSVQVKGQDSFGQTATSASVPFTVTLTANTGPTALITNTVTGAGLGTTPTFHVGAAITNQFYARDVDGTIARVEFLLNGQVYFAITNLTAATNNLQIVVNDAWAGAATYQIRAIDDCGAVGLSPVVSVNVTNPPYALLVTNGSSWKYMDNGLTNSTLDWTGLLFSDALWSNGVAELGFGDQDANIAERTTITRFSPTIGTNVMVYYFRKTFNVANPAAYSSLQLSVLRDDGVVVYLNGTQVFTTPTFTPPALPGNAADDGTLYISTNITGASPLVVGPNIVAVQLWQTTTTSSDVSFDLMLCGLAGGGACPDPKIAINESGAVVITWTTGTLVQSSDVTLPLAQWTPVVATSPYQPPITGQKFYKVPCP